VGEASHLVGREFHHPIVGSSLLGSLNHGSLRGLGQGCLGGQTPWQPASYPARGRNLLSLAFGARAFELDAADPLSLFALLLALRSERSFLGWSCCFILPSPLTFCTQFL